MSAMADPLATVTALLAPAFAEVAGRDGVDPVVRPSDRADAQVNGALALAKELGRTPRDVAQAVIDTGVLDGVCSSVEVAGPGFVNLVFDDEFLARELAAVAPDDRLGVAVATHAHTVVVDYSAPNVAKEMHVGHLRSTIIGDALARMLGFAGHRVIRENHIGDWGRPFGMLIEHLLDIGEEAAAEAASMGDLDGFYKAATAKFEASEDFQARARQRVVLLQSGDPETREHWTQLVAMSTRYFNTAYRRLGVLLTDDDIAAESRYQPLMPRVVERLEQAGLLVESEGADVVFPPGFTNREGEPLPLIIRSSAGGFNYATSDLACVLDRVERIGADLMLYVVDAGQSQHFQMVFAVARMAGLMTDSAEAVHVPFGVVLGEDRKRLRSRSGDSVKLIELLDEAVERATEAIAEKNPDLTADERAIVAQSVGIGALKYADLSNDRIKDYVFDWDRMLAFEGNTAPYLQYAHARICSIFRRADIDRPDVRSAAIVLGTPQERTLAQRVLALPSALDDSLSSFSPHKLCGYLFDLSQDFTAFYEHCPVLRADEPQRTSRLALCDLVARTIAHGLGLLGIEAPEQM
jgi:arginyl-tRNA synthetase